MFPRTQPIFGGEIESARVSVYVYIEKSAEKSVFAYKTLFAFSSRYFRLRINHPRPAAPGPNV